MEVMHSQDHRSDSSPAERLYQLVKLVNWHVTRDQSYIPANDFVNKLLAIRRGGITPQEVAYNLLRMVAAEDAVPATAKIIETIYETATQCLPLMAQYKNAIYEGTAVEAIVGDSLFDKERIVEDSLNKLLVHLCCLKKETPIINLG